MCELVADNVDLDVKFWKSKVFHLKSVLERSLFSVDELAAIDEIVEKYNDEHFPIENMFVLPQPLYPKIEIVDAERNNAAYDNLFNNEIPLSVESSSNNQQMSMDISNGNDMDAHNAAQPLLGIQPLILPAQEVLPTSLATNSIISGPPIDAEVETESMVNCGNTLDSKASLSGESSSNKQQKCDSGNHGGNMVELHSTADNLNLGDVNVGAVPSSGSQPLVYPTQVASRLPNNDLISGQIEFIENVSNCKNVLII